MKSQILQLAAHVLVFSAMSASAAIRYVDVNSASPAPPYTNWTTAATTIQAAIDAAVAGEQILVTNGVYQTGGRVVFGAMTNRVTVDKPVTVQSVNGAAVTVIRGYQVPGTTSGSSAIRCVYLTNGAALVGFTLTNGATRSLGNDVREQGGGGAWCESTGAVVSNCVLTGNSAYYGGGAYEGTLNNCTLSGNSAGEGGGAYGGTLNNCTLTGNSAAGGGGAAGSTLNNCTLTGNSACYGGGANSCTLNNCTLTGNSACYGGGANSCTLNNCTLAANSALNTSGGAIGCTLNNSIVYYNSAPFGDNYSDSSFSFSCTTPLPPEGVGNISFEPQLVDLSHLGAGSPCRGAGSAAYATGLDIDGEAWANSPSMGCDEYHPAAVIGPLSVSIQAAYTHAAVGFTANFTAAIDGRATANRWEFGDGTVVSNRPYASHSWTMAGDYLVVLQAYNDIYPGGISATVTVHVVSQPVHYVALGSANPVAPYTSWATAANNIQDAVDAALEGGALVLVTNGVYQTGGRVVFGAMTNRVTVDKPVTVQSVNGAAVTVIRGFQVSGMTNGDSAIRCVYLSDGAALVGFTLTNGATRTSGDDVREQSGGGVWCDSVSAVVSNCVLTANSAYYGGGASGGTLHNCTLTDNSAAGGGGGAWGGTLNNCTLTGNSASDGGGMSYCTLNNCTLTGNSAGRGGGASGGTLNNCTLTGNSAAIGGGTTESTLNNCTLTGNFATRYGGGASGGTLNNCIVYYNNSARNWDNYGDNYSGSFFSYSCTTPLPPVGVGNISGEPQLADLSHLSTGSPCRGAGSAAYATGLDIDGETWVNPPSIGCDEFHPGAVTGSLSVSIQSAYTNVAVGFALSFTAVIDGRAIANRWDFGDGTVVSNQPYTSHSWAVAGEYSVVFRAYNDTYPDGVRATVTVQVMAQPVHYVALVSAKPVAPYTSWATAANNIQDAIDATSVTGALVLVTNGIYQTGGRVVFAITNRVAVNKPVTVQSVNGPAVTVIRGSQVPGTTNGDSAIRCVYLTNGATLVGFTLTNGATRNFSLDLRQMSGGGVWSESTKAVVSNCTLSGNSAGEGGGAYGGTLNDCTLSGNSAYGGGGASSGTLNNCTLTGNSGSGAIGCTLNNCTLTGNSASYGGGAGNCTLNNCALTANLASVYGGGAETCTLNNCTLTGNFATRNGGGASGGTLNNCIVYYNNAPIGDNYSGSVLSYSCTTPLPPDGVGNIIAAPQLSSASHLSVNSPCRGAGSAAYATGLDIDGEPWSNPPSIGCDEYHPGAVAGPLSVSIQAAYTNAAVGFTVNFTAAVDGRVTANRWEFSDGTVVSNRPYASHSWAVAGDFLVVLRAYNDTYPDGVSAMVTVQVVAQPVHYVALGTANPVAPYTSWATASTNIQDAVDATSVTGALVLVTNGVYQTGGRVLFETNETITNRVAVNKPVTVQSVNGAAVTVIRGFQVPGTTNGDSAIRCVSLTNGAALVGFTLINGATRSYRDGDYLREQSGGGVWCESASALVSNCVLTGNSAYSEGGGAIGGTLNNCTLSGNSASNGGGATGCTLNNCTLTGNSAGSEGGGATACTLNNCIVYYNIAPNGDNYSYSSLNYSCTTPLPTNGMGNLTNAPLFVDYAGGNLRLSSNSPCINAGANASGPPGPDPDVNPRIVGGTVDIGAYEFQSPQSLISYAWLQQYNLPTDGSADNTDADSDGLNNWQEWHTGTDPTNAISVLRLLSPASAASGLVVSWQSVSGVNYFLDRGTDLGAQPPFLPLASDIAGQPGTTTFTDTTAVGAGPFFYRVGVQE